MFAFLHKNWKNMENKVMCSQCKHLKKGEGKESFVSPQGVHTTIHHGRYYCKADLSKRFTDEQIKESRNCSFFRTRTITFNQEVVQKLTLFLRKSLLKIWEFFKISNIGR